MAITIDGVEYDETTFRCRRCKNSISTSAINANAQIAKFASRNYLITNSNCTSSQ